MLTTTSQENTKLIQMSYALKMCMIYCTLDNYIERKHRLFLKSFLLTVSNR